MISLNDLKNVPLLSGLPDAILEKLLTITTEQTYEDGQTIYDMHASADNFYIVKNGKALLEYDLNPNVSVSLASLKPGYIFGWYALSGETHSMRAISADNTDLMVIPGDELRQLMDEDHDFGYQMMNKMFMLMKIRLDRRTEQFVKVMARHPDLNLGEE